MGMVKKITFERMCEEDVQLGDVTFIFLLSACSHAGLVDGGMCCYASMSSVYMILQHWNITSAW
jgi:hypothetical protein